MATDAISLEVFILQSPVYAGEMATYVVAGYDENGAQTDVTFDETASLTPFEIPSLGTTVVNTNNIYPQSPGSYHYLFKLTNNLDTNLIALVSFVAIKSFTFPNQQQLESIVAQEEPPKVFSPTKLTDNYAYVTRNAFAQGLAYFYSLYTSGVLDSIYPLTTPVKNRCWETILSGYSNYYPDDQVQYICSYLYQLRVQNKNTPYAQSYQISYYIFLRTGINLYVYVDDYTIYGFNFWVLGVSTLGVNTYLFDDSKIPKKVTVYVVDDANSLSDDFKNELTLFIRRYMRAGLFFETVYDQTLTDLDMLANIGNTYPMDPRLRSFALSYSSNNMNNSVAYINPYTFNFIVSLEILPESDTVSVDVPFALSCTATFEVPGVGGSYTKDITFLGSISFGGDPDSATIYDVTVTPIESGNTFTVSYTYGGISSTNIYLIA